VIFLSVFGQINLFIIHACTDVDCVSVCTVQPNTVSTDTANVSLPATTTEWPSVTKLPAKFSHKWKNRTSLSSMDVTHSSTTPLTAYAAPKGAAFYFLNNTAYVYQ